MAHDLLVFQYLQSLAFTPALTFDQAFTVTVEHLQPWPELQAWIPGRLQQILAELATHGGVEGNG